MSGNAKHNPREGRTLAYIEVPEGMPGIRGFLAAYPQTDENPASDGAFKRYA
jgi:hypothetical protein